jgi:hypothetical protein
VPEYNVTAIIKAGDLNYEEKARVKQLLVPIYPELERVSIKTLASVQHGVMSSYVEVNIPATRPEPEWAKARPAGGS